MKKAFLTASYILSHLAAMLLCISFWVIVPFVTMLVFAIIWDDPGGPLFWPFFLLLFFIAGVVCAVVLSFFTLIVDLTRLRWHFPIWSPALVITGIVTCLEFCAVGLTAEAIANGLFFGVVASAIFSLYWLTVSIVWFLPRMLARFFSSPKTSPIELPRS